MDPPHINPAFGVPATRGGPFSAPERSGVVESNPSRGTRCAASEAMTCHPTIACDSVPALAVAVGNLAAAAEFNLPSLGTERTFLAHTCTIDAVL